MADAPEIPDPAGWTGEPDPLAAEVIIFAIIIAAIGFLTIGALIAHS